MVHRRALVVVALTVASVLFLLTRSLPSNPRYSDTPIHHVDASQSTLHGDVIMPKLGNETENGECAGHFRQILAQYPPQTSSRSSAAAWACHVHNVVNKSLKKQAFDCSKIGDFYKCGCAEDDEGSKKGSEESRAGSSGELKIVKQTEDGGGDPVPDSPKGTRMKLEREGLTARNIKNCGDVLTKKKLDPHRNRCKGASFTCLDCMVHFRGMEYRAHTSCVSEAQKYQGALYKENAKQKNSKATKAQKRANSQALVPRQPYVEDAPDPDAGAIAIVDVPPHAPSPPPILRAVPAHQPEQLALPAVNVFDFLVTDDTPNASRVSLPAPPPPQPQTQPSQPPQPLQQEQQQHYEGMKMVENAPALFDINRTSPMALNGEDGAMILQEYEEKMYESDRQGNDYQDHYTDNASMYSAQAQSQDRAQEKRERLQQQPQQQSQQQVYLTPAPKREREASKQRDGSRGREHKSKDGKKRKRHHAEDLDLTAARPSFVDRDSVMTEAPTLHSGLTGGIEKMFSRRSGAEYPSPSPDFPDDIPVAETPASPLKRTRHSRTETRPEPRGRDKRARASLLLSLVSSGTSTVSTRKSSSSTQHTASDDRPPKKHHRHRRRDDSERPHQPKVKAIEYHPLVEKDDSRNQLVVYRTRAELFTSFICKGPESTLGCSMNKALKRYHRERADQGIGMGRAEEEKELWKSLRMKRNDRGEIVLFF